MAQAECITTAIRKLMSRGWPPKSASPVRAAHAEFVAALVGNVPHPIYAEVDSEDNALRVIRNAAEEMRERENWRAS